MTENRIIPPLSDTMMSKIFEDMGTSLAAQSLINAILEDAGRKPLDIITDLRCQETYPGRANGGRSCRLDITAETNGHKVNIEVQRSTDNDMIDRSVFYGCAMLHESLNKAESYSQIPRFTLVNLIDFKAIRDSHPDFHQPIKLMYEKGNREIASDIITIHNLELLKFNEIPFDKENALHRWIYYLKEGYLQPESTATKEVINMDAGIRQFAEKYNINHQDPHLIEKYTQERMAELDYATDMMNAEQKGIAIGEAKGIKKGLEKGITEGKIEMLKLAIRVKTPVAVLMAMQKQAGISNDEYEKILNEVKNEHSKPTKDKIKSKNDTEL